MRYTKSAIAGLVFCASAANVAAQQHAETVPELIKRQSQEFSDASATGDSAAFARLLDDSVAFMNESGDIATKQDILASAKPSPRNFSNSLVQTDFTIAMHGNVAVTTFTDSSNVNYYGQPMHARYRSTEVWLEEKDGWKMISSQTIALPDDPPAMKLSSRMLQDYVGTYKAGDVVTFKITRTGNLLFGSTNNSKPYPILAEAPDVLFSPGHPRMRRIFQRNEKGLITGFVTRQEGHDFALKRVG